jgi:hypothetical protein
MKELGDGISESSLDSGFTLPQKEISSLLQSSRKTSC